MLGFKRKRSNNLLQLFGILNQKEDDIKEELYKFGEYYKQNGGCLYMTSYKPNGYFTPYTDAYVFSNSFNFIRTVSPHFQEKSKTPDNVHIQFPSDNTIVVWFGDGSVREYYKIIILPCNSTDFNKQGNLATVISEELVEKLVDFNYSKFLASTEAIKKVWVFIHVIRTNGEISYYPKIKTINLERKDITDVIARIIEEEKYNWGWIGGKINKIEVVGYGYGNYEKIYFKENPQEFDFLLKK